MKNHHYRKYWLTVGVILIATVFYLCLKKPGNEGFYFPFFDKIIHCSAYAMLSWWFFQLFDRPRLIFCSFLAMGVLIEFLQRLTPYRSFEFADMAANTVGVVLGMTVFTLLFKNSLLLIDNKIFAYLNRKRTCR